MFSQGGQASLVLQTAFPSWASATALQRAEPQAAKSRGPQRLHVHLIFLQLTFHIYGILALSTLMGAGNQKII